jgi:hypothetical protein
MPCHLDDRAPLDVPSARTNGRNSSRWSQPSGLSVGSMHFVRRPADVRPLALVELPVAAVGDAVEDLDREQRLREVLQEQVVAVELHLDGVEPVHRVPFVGADQTDELAVPVQHGPDAGALANGALAAAAGHRHREQPAAQHRLLDAGDDLQVVLRPGQVEGEREVAVAEEAEVARRPCLAFRVLHRRQFADVAVIGPSEPASNLCRPWATDWSAG